MLQKLSKINYQQLAADIKHWGTELGFANVGITDTNLSQHEQHLSSWLAKNNHSTMDYMEQNKEKRLHPEKLLPGTKTVICVSLNYQQIPEIKSIAGNNCVSLYARRRDYHKIIRKKLQKLANKIEQAIGEFSYRAFCDSAPVLEKALAEKAGVGWIGKNTCLVNKDHGSLFFLGELFTDLPLPIDTPAKNHCGNCKKCIESCPTGALADSLNANHCISYLTIESKKEISEELKTLIGTQIFGCDKCQLICPWNNTAKQPEHLSQTDKMTRENLLKLSHWSKEEFLENTRGTPIGRIDYERWSRNIAVALENIALKLEES
jgi:epoxyqueuosine reductase